MYAHKARYRVIYADTDNMGIAYHANYLRWFEIGRSEMFRALGLPYKEIELKGILLPVSEMQCKFLAPARYDDIIVIKTQIDTAVKGGIKFDYRILSEDEKIILAKGYTKHACVNGHGKVVRPPDFLSQFIKENIDLR